MSINDLTPRELEILQLLVAGKSNKEIARDVFICKKTVEFHLDHIYSTTSPPTPRRSTPSSASPARSPRN